MPLPVIQSKIPLDKILTDGSEKGASVAAKLNKAFAKIDNAIFLDGSMELRAGYTPAASQEIATKVYVDTKLATSGAVDMDAGYSPARDQSVTTKKYVQDELTKENPTRNPFSIISQLSDINLKDADFHKGDEFYGINLICKTMPDSSLFLVPGDIVTPNFNSIIPDGSNSMLRIFKHSNGDVTVEGFSRAGTRAIQWMGSYDGVQGHERWSGWKRMGYSDNITMTVYKSLSDLGIVGGDLVDETVGIYRIFKAMDEGTTALISSTDLPEFTNIMPDKGQVPGFAHFTKGKDGVQTVTYYPTDGQTKALWLGNFGGQAWSGWTDVSKIDETKILSYKGQISFLKEIKETGLYYSTLLLDSPDPKNPEEFTIMALINPIGEKKIFAIDSKGKIHTCQIDIQGIATWTSRSLYADGAINMENNYVPQENQSIATKSYVDLQAAQKGAVKVFEVADIQEMMNYISVGEASMFIMDNGEYWVRNSGTSGTVADFNQVAENPKVYFVQTLQDMYNLDANLSSTIIVHETNNTYLKVKDNHPATLGDFYQIRVHSEPQKVKTIKEMLSLNDPIPGKIVVVDDLDSTYILKAGVDPRNPSSWIRVEARKPIPNEVSDFSVVKQLNPERGTLFVLDKEKETIIRKTTTDGSRNDYVTLKTHGAAVNEFHQERVVSDGNNLPQGGTYLRMFKMGRIPKLRTGHKYICSFMFPGIITKRLRHYSMMARLAGSTTWVPFFEQEVQGPFAADADIMRVPVHLESMYSAAATSEVEFAIGVKEEGIAPGTTIPHGVGEVTFEVREITIL